MPAHSNSLSPLDRWTWPRVAWMAALVLGLPALIIGDLQLADAFDEKSLLKLNKQKPECLLIGDSMLETRIDEKLLSQISGQRCLAFAQPGSGSAAWYLMLKNFAAEQRPPPHTVIILYRERQLTLPRFRAQGEYRDTLDSYMKDSDPLIEELVQSDGKAKGWMDRWIDRIYPLTEHRRAAQHKIQMWALDWNASSREYDAIQDHANQIFGPKRLRVGTLVDEKIEGNSAALAPKDHAFAAEVGHSFLPHMMEEARRKRIHLIFYEVKRRPRSGEEVGAGDAAYQTYENELRAYLDAGGARLFDETSDAEVTADFYGSGDHVAPAMMARYTQIFWGNVAPWMKADTVR